MNPPWAGGGSKPKSFNPLKNIVPAKNTPARGEAQATSAAGRGQAASTARYQAMGNAYSPVTQNPGGPPPGDDNSGGGDTIIYGQQSQAAQAAPAMPDVSVETLTKTPEYLARERALQSAMDLFGSRQGTERVRFEENLNKSFGELGFNPASASFDLGELLSSGQRATTSGRAYNALRNDFAARGMLQSGAFQGQRGVLTDQLMRQQQALEGSRTRFTEDQAAALAQQQMENEQQRRAALDEARQALLSRFAMGG
jgi:hypothetical protein